MKTRKGNLGIKEVEVTEKGVTYKTYRIDGYDLNGNRVRYRSQDPKLAKLKLLELQTQVYNAEVSNPLRLVQTRLTDTKIHDAEAAFALLGDRGSLLEAVRAALDGNGFAVKLTPVALSAAATEYLAEAKDRIRPRTLAGKRNLLGRFEEFTKNPLLANISTETIKKFVASLRAENGVDPAKPKTRNNVRAELHAFFEWCIDPREYLAANPAHDISLATIDRNLIEVLPLTKCQELMTRAANLKDAKTARYFALALFAGIRPEEIGKLDPRAIDLQNNVIHISESVAKTHDARDVIIQPNLRKWLLRYPTGTLSQYNSFVQIVRKETGLTGGVRDVARHTFISNHVMAFGSFAETAIESGNTESIIKAHYFRRVSKSNAQAFWQIVPEIA
jgi:site-specific recombinase XerD